MQCPTDNIDLVMTERQGVEIDYCPKCRGVWLDKGELDKIIEKIEAASNTQPVQGQVVQDPYIQPQPYYGGKHGGNSKHGKRKGLLGELFDF